MAMKAYRDWGAAQKGIGVRQRWTEAQEALGVLSILNRSRTS